MTASGDKEELRAHLLALHEETGDEDFRRAAAALEPRKKRGRPSITTLPEMAAITRKIGPEKNALAAIREVAAEIESPLQESTKVERLKRMWYGAKGAGKYMPGLLRALDGWQARQLSTWRALDGWQARQLSTWRALERALGRMNRKK